MIKYYKLFDLLTRRGMKKTDLLEVISAPTIAKLSKGDIIKTDTIDKICLYLECQPSDIMEVIFDESEVSTQTGTKTIYKMVDREDDTLNEYLIDDNTAIREIVEDPEKAKEFIKYITEKYVNTIKPTK